MIFINMEKLILTPCQHISVISYYKIAHFLAVSFESEFGPSRNVDLSSDVCIRPYLVIDVIIKKITFLPLRTIMKKYAEESRVLQVP